MLADTRAVILAAGIGSRLRPHTEFTPKPLVRVNGVPILHNALRQLSDLGVREAVIVVGYREGDIVRSCGDRFGNLELHYIHNEVFDRTGSAYSLWLARSTMMGGDILFLEGDVFFERTVLERTVSSVSRDRQNVAAVAAFDAAMTGSAVELSGDGSITTFSLNNVAAEAQARGLFKTVNMMRLSASASRELIVPALQRAVEHGHLNCFVEEVLADLVEDRTLQLSAADCTNTRWIEIDCVEDLRSAEALFGWLTG
ncbi:phosphocholine cytidylyltransferase family protein [Bradyrhizobium sp. DOA9]|uniref:phosphocholine cytidylyltransferase family protein n=1 Tax=Bradyrhizobium sp. DOA9 TaxID=1126627 RepID=UPI00046969A9|nr:phosphocholine cytidylyltransferase family protein [Bradyrhizobium sp. DOA9]GAJ37802.1 hypothetical acetyltransferase MJ1101 [Bradyrhizobium sp. DOA9]